MKKIIVTIVSTLVLFSLTGCEKFLTEVPKSSLVAENSFSTSSDWEEALTGAYAMLQTVFMEKYTITLNEFGTDEVEPFDLSWAAYVELKKYTFNAQHEFFRCHYIWCYDGIKRANTVLGLPSTANVSDSDRKLWIAQAKFLRAIFYFDLVTYYGGVPIWTSSAIDPEQISHPRATAAEVYDLILADMEEAAASLPESWPDKTDAGRATSLAAYAFLGRFYLQCGKPDKALEALNKIPEGKFSLYTNLNDIFLPAHKNEFKENIFEVQFKHSGNWGLEGSIQSSYWGPRGGGGPTNNAFGWGGFGPTQYLYDSYEPGDKRRSAWFCTEYRGVPQNPPCTMKFRDPDYGNQIEDDDLNYVMMRYADVLLMKAEALNEVGDESLKYDCINKVRARAGVAPLSGLSKDAFKAAVLKERLLELNCEHHRRTDLIRFGKLAEQVHAAFPDITLDDHFNLYPIPQQAIDSNDLMTEKDQNPGY